VKQREQIQMSPAEVCVFLADQRTMAVATLGPDGYPHVVAMWYALVDGDIAFWTYARAQKAVNLRRDPRLTCLVEAGDVYSELRGVQVKGTAVLVEDAEAVYRLGVMIHERYHGAPLPADVERKVAAQAPKRLGVYVRPVRIVTWDHRKLGGGY
jgi:PPOX class probable F420-dependent enzyme